MNWFLAPTKKFSEIFETDPIYHDNDDLFFATIILQDIKLIKNIKTCSTNQLNFIIFYLINYSDNLKEPVNLLKQILSQFNSHDNLTDFYFVINMKYISYEMIDYIVLFDIKKLDIIQFASFLYSNSKVESANITTKKRYFLDKILAIYKNDKKNGFFIYKFVIFNYYSGYKFFDILLKYHDSYHDLYLEQDSITGIKALFFFSGLLKSLIYLKNRNSEKMIMNILIAFQNLSMKSLEISLNYFTKHPDYLEDSFFNKPKKPLIQYTFDILISKILRYCLSKISSLLEHPEFLKNLIIKFNSFYPGLMILYLYKICHFNIDKLKDVKHIVIRSNKNNTVSFQKIYLSNNENFNNAFLFGATFGRHKQMNWEKEKLFIKNNYFDSFPKEIKNMILNYSQKFETFYN